MKFRDSERWEYIRQPHVIALIVLVLVVLAGAVYTAVDRIQDASRRSKLPTDQACTELVKDIDLCYFAAATEAAVNATYISVTTTVQDGSTSVTTSEFENANRIRTITQTNGQESEALLVLDANNYARDYTDGTWAHYQDPEFQPIDSSNISEAYDFSSETSADVVEFRDYYQRQGEEPCGEMICLKYKILGDEELDQTTYIWFDTQDYRLRRIQVVSGQDSSNTQYDYKPVTLTAPSPVKEVDEATFLALVQ